MPNDVDTDATDSTTDTSADDEQQSGTDPLAAALAETERWKRQARENEKRAKENAAAAKRVEELERQSMTDTEKAVETARAEATAETARRYGERLAAADIRVALTGLVDDPNVVIEDLNLARFIAADGEPDSKAITELRKKYERLIPAKGVPRVPTGARNGTDPVDVGSMSMPEFIAARKSGRIS